MSWVKVLLVVQIMCVLFMLSFAFLHKFSVLPFKPAFLAFAFANLLIVAILIVAIMSVLYARVMHTQWALGWAPHVVIGLIPVCLLFAFVGLKAAGAPRIHDISTRFEPPVLFEHGLTLRGPAENSLQPPSESVRSMQSDFYTDIQPLVLQHSAEACFEQALEAAKYLGWDVSASDADKHWFEAVDETRLFGFKDDIRVEIDGQPQRCEVNVRSVSRVGVSDVGANAKRIRRFLKAIELKPQD